MAWPKGKKRGIENEKHSAVEPETPVYGNEPAEEVREAVERRASHNMWLYHKTEPARLFKMGELIPDGYHDGSEA